MPVDVGITIALRDPGIMARAPGRRPPSGGRMPKDLTKFWATEIPVHVVNTNM